MRRGAKEKKKMRKKGYQISTILGVRLFSGRFEEALKRVVGWVEEKGDRKRYIVTPNPEQLVLAQKDEEFKRVLNGADLAVADGVGVVWASRWLGQPVEERITGRRLMVALCQQAAKRGWRVFFLGGRERVAEKAAAEVRRRFGLRKSQIAAFGGARDIRQETEEERKETIERINRFKPHLLFVAYGAPWQEKWLAKNLGRLKIRVGMVVGGVFDQLADSSLLAPTFIERYGLEWFYRLLRQPWRLKRQLRLVKFLGRVIKDKKGGRDGAR